MIHRIVAEELELLASVKELLAQRREPASTAEAPLVEELLRLREQLVARPEGKDSLALREQWHRHASLLRQLRASQAAPQVDPRSPYFAHLRLLEEDGPRDLCLGRATCVEQGIRIVDWRNAPVSRIYYRYEQGDEYEERFAGRVHVGRVLARRSVVIRDSELERVEAPGAPIDLKYAATSAAPAFPFHASSGGKVKMLSTDPVAAGINVCGRCSVSKTSLAGARSATHIRCMAKPGRAGSTRTSGDGASLTRLERPGSRSMATTRRAGFTPGGSFWSGFGFMTGSLPCAVPAGPSANSASNMSKAIMQPVLELSQRCHAPTSTTTSPGLRTSLQSSSSITRSPESRIP